MPDNATLWDNFDAAPKSPSTLPYKRRNSIPDTTPGIPVICEDCGATYHVQRLRPDRTGSQKLCIRCRSRKALRLGRTTFATPESTKAERIRANGLINKRLKLGWFTRPELCAKCGRRRRLTGHHADYSKPAVVFFVCYGCHQKAHKRPGYLAGINPINTDLFRPAPKPQATGERSHNAKMTDAQAQEMRERYAAGGVSQEQLAIEYDVSKGAAWSVIKGMSYPASPVTDASLSLTKPTRGGGKGAAL